MMKALIPSERDGQASLFDASFSEITISKIPVLMASVDGAALLSLSDLHRALSYKGSASNFRRSFARNGEDLAAHIVWLRPPIQFIRNAAHPKILFIDQHGLILLCNALPPYRVAELRKWLAAHGIKKGLETFSQTQTIFSSLIGKHTVRVAHADGQVLLAARDAFALLGYSDKSGGQPLRFSFFRRGETIDNYVIRLRFGDRVPPAFINSSGLEKMCALIKPAERTAILRQWLDRYKEWKGDTKSLIASMGGTDVREAYKVVRSDRTGGRAMQLSPSSKTTAIRRTVPAAAPPPQPPLVTQPDPERTHQRDYGAQLASVIARHATADELDGLVRTLEGLKSDILARRYAPDLNSAVYELFARFNLASPTTGSAVGQASTGAAV